VERHGQIIGIKPEKLEEYKRYHSDIWPEVADMISKCNIHNYSIYQMGDKLFAYFEYTGSDFNADMKKMAEHKKTQEWWSVMGPLQQPLAERKEGEWWAEMTEVFHQE
jgi:L-rhamnose mutarotase